MSARSDRTGVNVRVVREVSHEQSPFRDRLYRSAAFGTASNASSAMMTVSTAFT